MRRLHAIAFAGLLVLFVGLGIDGARRETPTVDEYAHLPAGCAAWRYGVFDLYPEDPPLARLWMAWPVLAAGAVVPAPAPELSERDWGPWIYGQRFFDANRDRYLRFFFLARLASLAATVAGGVLLALWAGRLYGRTAGIVALALYTLCPNIQAHARLATVDGTFTAVVVAMFAAFDACRRRPSMLRVAAIGVLAGAALMTKMTAVLLLPLLFALIIVASLGEGAGLGARGPLGAGAALGDGVRPRRGGMRAWPRAGGRGVGRCAVVAGIALVVLHLGYGLGGVLRPLQSFRFQSAFCGTLARALPPSMPVPLPAAYVVGFDRQKLDTERGEFGTYFAGEWRRTSPAVLPAAILLLKLPLVTLALAVWAILRVFARRRFGLLERGRFGVLEASIWLPPALLLVSFSALNALALGVRHLLPALPFLFLGIASLADPTPGGARAAATSLSAARPRSRRKIVLGSALAGLLVLTLWTHPRQIAFFNILGGGPRGGDRWLIDSNLDWGQDLALVPAYMKRDGLARIQLLYFGHVEPELYGIRYEVPTSNPAPGTTIVSVNFVKGYDYVAPDHGRFLRFPQGAPPWIKSASPVDRIGASLWVYRVP